MVPLRGAQADSSMFQVNPAPFFRDCLKPAQLKSETGRINQLVFANGSALGLDRESGNRAALRQSGTHFQGSHCRTS